MEITKFAEYEIGINELAHKFELKAEEILAVTSSEDGKSIIITTTEKKKKEEE